MISSVPGESGRWFEGKSIKDIAARKGTGCRDALLDVLVKEGQRAVFQGAMQEKNDQLPENVIRQRTLIVPIRGSPSDKIATTNCFSDSIPPHLLSEEQPIFA